MQISANQNSPQFAERVRAVAYALWLEEGRPEGRAEHHWLKANELVAREIAAPAAKPKSKPAVAAAKKAAPRKRG